MCLMNMISHLGMPYCWGRIGCTLLLGRRVSEVMVRNYEIPSLVVVGEGPKKILFNVMSIEILWDKI